MFKKAMRWMLTIGMLISLCGPLLFSQEPQAMTIDAAQKQAIVDEISALLNKNYIFAETAKKMEELIRGRLKNGDYDKLTEARDFAQAVSQDLTSMSRDKHLGFAFAPQMAAEIRRRRSQNEDEAKAGQRRPLRSHERRHFFRSGGVLLQHEKSEEGHFDR